MDKKFSIERRLASVIAGLVWLLLGLLPLNAATLVWDPNPAEDGVTHYSVYIQSELGFESHDTTDTTFPLDALTSGIHYTLLVTANSPKGESLPTTIDFFVPSGPIISRQPVSQNIAAGGSFELLVEATGTPPFSFRWFRNGMPLLSQTGQSLFVANAGSADEGEYTVEVSNTGGSQMSAPATINILVRPSIITQPLPQIVAAGGRLFLSAVAAGSTPLYYQWFHNNQPIAGARSDNYAVLSATPAHAGSYFVRVTNLVGSVQSTSVSVTVEAPPSITQQPQSIIVSEDSQIALTVSALGSTPLSYQWARDGVPLPGRTTSSLVIASASKSDEGRYTVSVRNPYGTIESYPALVTVTQSSIAPAIITQPRSKTIGVGETVTLEVLANGTAPLAYQWFKNGTAIANATGTSLFITEASESDSGSYTVVVSNPLDTVTSQAAKVSVLVPPQITSSPGATNVATGGVLVLNVKATGSAPLTYEWYKDGQLLIDAREATITVSPVRTDHAGNYLVIVSNGAGSVSSTAASVGILDESGIAPRISAHPQGIYLEEGESGSIQVVAEGVAPLTFQWFKDGQALPGQTNAVVSITSAVPANTGFYTVRIANRFGSVTSDPAEVVVTAFPKFLLHPVSRDVRLGNSFQLEAAASSSEALHYQWLKDGVEIAGANTPIYRVISMQPTHVGTYRIRVSNSFGAVLSQEAIVVIAMPPEITIQPASKTVSEGSELRLSFAASGSGPFTVAWLKGNILVQTTTETELIIPQAQVSDAGTYVGRVSNAAGAVETTPATVRIAAKPVISQHPQGTAVPLAGTVMLSVSASGEGTLHYQWYKNGQPISGAQQIFHMFTARSDADFGTYCVRVSNAAGFTESNPATVEEVAVPKITIQPAAREVLEGTGFALTVTAIGSGPLSYQWFKDGAALPGATSTSLEVTSSQSSQGGLYKAVVTNPLGSDESASVRVSVVPRIVITQQPASTNLPHGAPLRLAVAAASTIPLSYQWFRGDSLLGNETNAVLEIPNVTASEQGAYHVRLQNRLEQIQSDTAQVVVALGQEIAGGLLTIKTAPAGLEITGQGLPNTPYEIQLSSDIRGSNWITIDTVQSDAEGRFVVRAPGTGGGYWFIRAMHRE